MSNTNPRQYPPYYDPRTYLQNPQNNPLFSSCQHIGYHSPPQQDNTLIRSNADLARILTDQNCNPRRASVKGEYNAPKFVLPSNQQEHLFQGRPNPHPTHQVAYREQKDGLLVGNSAQQDSQMPPVEIREVIYEGRYSGCYDAGSDFEADRKQVNARKQLGTIEKRNKNSKKRVVNREEERQELIDRGEEQESMGRDEGEHVETAGVDGMGSDLEQEKHEYFLEMRKRRRKDRRKHCG